VVDGEVQEEVSAVGRMVTAMAAEVVARNSLQSRSHLLSDARSIVKSVCLGRFHNRQFSF
jgi:hypothetical protein